ncbi:hypothetical protein V6N12_060965 [Hibiscus sabdariffa]|uniref:Uncharacterized protein n=1 Tax=Hibiscus sabdariffa TaxID=183260 RepID=A0ABR2DVN2_9ROSI
MIAWSFCWGSVLDARNRFTVDEEGSLNQGPSIQALIDLVPSPTFTASIVGDAISATTVVYERGREQRLPATLFKTQGLVGLGASNTQWVQSGLRLLGL